jgi:Sulfotransferase domain
MEYFKDRSEELLVLNITAGEGWTKLCPFLNKQIPSVSFPRANIASERRKLPWSKNFWYRKFSRQAEELLRRSTEFSHYWKL